ncbi:tRNA (guanosine(18)-2'-O)-methyltransferase TrmH [Sansalvadorimonas sp. 2012CJ34-2]|uniref:tRNA (guanosine(18)-2'-O)-methyltransferase n=1 Tax=Parendozoicomonas callyspongiae TaxID=2942213 RepID=A0ABT0PEY5_9GAMM|nr:tRNA (guanosine(18)-2'-O)-methyltransferase TrmH [Sansalvadorimonas sp. 2012CJ34-2]MCL6269098.1 tRNA (guanosine(18)-2'-O)-methyltransferase TrmH [Sansalvadorimonas sp. 2012CJ34-2]
MTPERFQKLRTILSRRQPDLAVLADDVHKAHNLAAIIRTCDAVGIPKVHLCDPDIRARQLRGRSMGSNRWVEVEQYDNIVTAGQKLKDAGFKVIAAHFSDKAKPYHELDYTGPCALLMGAEKKGVSKEGAELADEHVIIPMQGMVQSFNVSVAAGIILMEAQRQRQAAGLYDRNQIPSSEYTSTLFRWSYPELARYCDDRNLNYPKLDEEGQLIQPDVWYEQIRANTSD